MKKQLYTFLAAILSILMFSSSRVCAADYTATVQFPANFAIGDYIEFAKLSPLDAGASGFYEVSISYARGNVAAAATHYVSVSHSNPNLWREAGRTNSNGYLSATGFNFTIDCNTQYGNSRLRIRAVNTLGVPTSGIDVHVKIRAINNNIGITALNTSGNDSNVVKLLPMTDEWDLYVGDLRKAESAHVAIKALANGNVGIGTATPVDKLSVNGKIRAHEIKVETTNWPDYVFADDYKLQPLSEVEQFVKLNKHLPEVPSAQQVEAGGVALGEMNKLLLKKVEELTLHLIEKDKQLNMVIKRLEKLEE